MGLRHPVELLARPRVRPCRCKPCKGRLVWSGLLKTAGAIVMSPEIGFVLALLLVLIVSWLFVHQTPFAVGSTFLAPAIRFGLALFARP